MNLKQEKAAPVGGKDLIAGDAGMRIGAVYDFVLVLWEKSCFGLWSVDIMALR